MINVHRTGSQPPMSLPRDTHQSAFAINGRYYSQRTTGVQRYAREIASALDQQLIRSSQTAMIIAPPNVTRDPNLDHTKFFTPGPFQGHAWEQITLPYSYRGPLLNLCNTAPTTKNNQIVCIHDANVYLQPDSYSAFFRTAYRTILPLLAKRCKIVTTVSRFSADQLKRFLPLDSRKLVIIPNGHEHVFNWDASSSIVGSRLRLGRPFVLLLGSKARHKNIDVILSQAGMLDAIGLDIVVVGGTNKIFSKSTEQYSDNVIRLGSVQDNDLAWLYMNALCLTFPSITEGFGLPIVEAMALGCPVISADQSSMPEVCGNAALMASAFDKSAWYQHISALAQSASLREDLRGRGHQQILQFSWIKSAQAYQDLMERM